MNFLNSVFTSHSSPEEKFRCGLHRVMHKELLTTYPLNVKNRKRVVDLVKLITKSLVHSEQNDLKLFV